ncbi:MAG TPA: hypothetical protein VJ654_20360 [Noviherbaspirillum sp.]|nr:hypothetical protein [Noviherbaspirillum sp.]
MDFGLGPASLMFQIGGAVNGAIGSYWSGRSQEIALEGQARLAEINARISELGAQSVLMQGQQQIGALTLKAGQLKGSQRAAMAANGIDLGTGNAAEIVASTDIMKEIDSNTINASAVRSAWGARTQAMNFKNEALMERAQASAISPGLNAATSLLTSAGSVASSWYSLNKSGALKGSPFELKG